MAQCQGYWNGEVWRRLRKKMVYVLSCFSVIHCRIASPASGRESKKCPVGKSVGGPIAKILNINCEER